MKALFLLEDEVRGRRCILVKREWEKKGKRKKKKKVTIVGGVSRVVDRVGKCLVF